MLSFLCLECFNHLRDQLLLFCGCIFFFFVLKFFSHLWLLHSVSRFSTIAWHELCMNELHSTTFFPFHAQRLHKMLSKAATGHKRYWAKLPSYRIKMGKKAVIVCNNLLNICGLEYEGFEESNCSNLNVYLNKPKISWSLILNFVFNLLSSHLEKETITIYV